MEAELTGKQSLSLWDSSAAESDYQNTFSSDGEKVDIAVIGGGYTGLSTALFAAESGLNVHVLEKEKIGYGGSGRNSGLVNAGVWLPPSDVLKLLGKSEGTKFLKIFGDAPKFVFDLIEKYQIRCEVTHSGTIHAAHAPSGMNNLKKRFNDWNSFGAPVKLLSPDEVTTMTGTNKFFGGLLDNRAGTINPMGYCRGLARVANNTGAQISTGVEVLKLTKNQKLWEVKTSQGSLIAKYVLLATNAYTDDLWPNLKRIFTVIHFLQMATESLESISEYILPERQGLWDTGKIMISLRKDLENRLILGSMGSVIGNLDRGLSKRWGKTQLKRLFPDIGDVIFEEAWQGQIALTPDHLPRIYNLDENLFTTIGYNGRGITTGTIFGKAIVDMIKTGSKESLPLSITELRIDPFASTKSSLYKLAFFANQLYKSI